MSQTGQEGTHKTEDGTELYTKTWEPPTSTPLKARLLLIHGFSDHCNNYSFFVDHLTSQGISIHAFDQRGWGRSVHTRKDRGHTGPTTLVLSDISSVLRTLLPSPVPVFLMGHSMGGAEILFYAAQGPSDLVSQIRGFISSAPLIALHPDTRPWKTTVMAGRVAGKLLPKFQLTNPLDSKWLSRDPEQNKMWVEDELCHDTGTLEGLAGMLDRGNSLETGKVLVKEGAGEGGKTRLLALHGTGDHINDYAATKTYVERCELEDKTLQTYDGWYHNSKFWDPAFGCHCY